MYHERSTMVGIPGLVRKRDHGGYTRVGEKRDHEAHTRAILWREEDHEAHTRAILWEERLTMRRILGHSLGEWRTMRRIVASWVWWEVCTGLYASLPP